MKKLRTIFLAKRVITFLLLFIALQTKNALAQTFPTNFAGVQLATKLDPVGMDVVPDGRVFVSEKLGRIRVIKNGAILNTPLITIPNVDNFSERGLLNVVVDPAFTTNGFIYTYYTHKLNGVINNRISRFKVIGDIAAPSTELVLIDIDPVQGTTGYHNGGGLAIKNNQLYISTGESTVASNSQSFATLKGKILRINKDGTIPTDNPFTTTATGKNKAIWALGLRNPYRLTIQNGTGRVFSTDVGAGAWEEINEITAGKNYGWPQIEGPRTNQTPPPNYQDPFYAYPHTGDVCAITAASFYNPETTTFPNSYIGKFFFGDYCAGFIKTLDPATKTVQTFATGIDRPLEVAVSKDGILYFIARGGIPGGSNESNTSSDNGVLWKVEYTGNGKPVIAVQPTNKTISIGESTTFQVFASGTPTPSFQWQRNGVSIAGANSPDYIFSNSTLADNGATFRVVVSNSAGTVTSSSATLTVINNQAPMPTISSPAAGKTYSGGEVITYSGSGTDTEDGDLPASAFTWKIELYHFDDPDHSHPALDPTTGSKSGTFTIPTEMETSPNVLFRIYLTVTDSKGSKRTVTRDIVPIISTMTLASNPANLTLKIDGMVVKSPYSFNGAKGIIRNLEAVSPQTLNGKTYVFSSWSDNGNQAHNISTPGANTTFTANFIETIVGAIIPGAIYELEPQHTLGQRLDVRGAAAANGTLVDMYTRNGNKNQQWKFVSVGNGLYELEPQHAIGKRLRVVGASTAQNAIVDIYQSEGTQNAIWKAISLGNGIYAFEPQNALGKRLDIERINNIESCRSRTADAGNSQKWKLIQVAEIGIIPNAIYELEPQHAIGKRLDVRGASAANSTLVDIFTRNGNKNQQWKLSSLGGDIYELEPQHAIGKRLGVVGASTDNNAAIDIYQSEGTANAKWKAVPLGNGIYSFEPQNALGKRLDAVLINAIESARSTIADPVKTSQRWKLIPIAVAARVSDEILIDQEEELVISTPTHDEEFFLYPDPWTDQAIINFPVQESNEKITIEIYTTEGQLLRTIDVSNKEGSVTLERKNLISGTYFYSLLVGGKITFTKRFVVN